MTRQRRTAFVIVALLLLATLCSVPWVLAYWRDFEYASTFGSKMEGAINLVEYQGNTDLPRERLTKPDQTEELKAWLLATRAFRDAESPDAPKCVCELRFFFDDGHEEVVQHSPFRESNGPEAVDVNEIVRIFYRGHDRFGSRATLASILAEPKS